MQRKLIKQGMGGYTIYLPKKWLDKKGLKEKDYVKIEEVENDLIIYSQKSTSNKNIIVKINNVKTESIIKTIITNTYRLGYDKIEIKFNNKKQYEIINHIIKKHFQGFEITKKETNSCQIEIITEPSENQFEILLQKIFYNSLELIHITRNKIIKKEINEDYKEIEEKINQYDNFCRRIITKKRFQRNSQLFWAFLTLIIHAQMEFYLLNKYLDNNKVQTNKNLLEYIDEIENMLRTIKKAYAKKDINILEEVHNSEKTLVYKKSELLFNNVNKSIIAHRLISAARKYYLSTKPLIGIII